MQISLMHIVAFWKRQGFSDKSTNSLPQGVVPTFDVVCFARLFADHAVSASFDDFAVGLPKIAERHTSSVCFGNQSPKSPATFRTPVADEIWHNLPRSAAKSHPNPPFETLWINKWPHFVQLQNIRFFRRQQRLYDVGERIGLFLIHLKAVTWLMPKVRPKPRDEERSCAARTTISLKSALLRTLSKTPPKPQDLHLYLGLPTPFDPFLTICAEPHLWQLLCSVTINLCFDRKLTQSLTLVHYQIFDKENFRRV